MDCEPGPPGAGPPGATLEPSRRTPIVREGHELEHSIVNLKSAGTEDFRDFRRF